MTKRDSLASFLILFAAMQLGASAVYFGFAVCTVVAVLLLAQGDRYRQLASRVVMENRWILLILVGYVVIASLVMAFQQVDSLHSWGELKWVFFFLVFVILCLPVFATDSWGVDRRVRICAWVLLSFTVFSVFAALYQFVTETDPFRAMIGQSYTLNPSRGHGLLSNPVPFAKLMGSMALIFLSLFLTLEKRLNMPRWVAGTAGFFSFAAVVASQSRGVWLSFLVLIPLATVFLPSRLRFRWLAIMLCVAAISTGAILALPSLSQRAETIINDTHHGSNRVRLEQWHTNWVILSRNPFGVGFDGNDQREEAIYEELGYVLPNKRGHCHNEFLEIVVATGWMGLVSYLAVSLFLLWRPLLCLRKMGEDDDPLVRFLLLASVLVQAFLHMAVITDQMDTQSRMIMSVAWGIALVGPTLVKGEGRSNLTES